MRVLFGTHEGRRVFALVADALLSGRDVEENKSILQAIEVHRCCSGFLCVTFLFFKVEDCIV
jgi:hypothetical protein